MRRITQARLLAYLALLILLSVSACQRAFSAPTTSTAGSSGPVSSTPTAKPDTAITPSATWQLVPTPTAPGPPSATATPPLRLNCIPAGDPSTWEWRDMPGLGVHLRVPSDWFYGISGIGISQTVSIANFPRGVYPAPSGTGNDCLEVTLRVAPRDAPRHYYDEIRSPEKVRTVTQGRYEGEAITIGGRQAVRARAVAAPYDEQVFVHFLVGTLLIERRPVSTTTDSVFADMLSSLDLNWWPERARQPGDLAEVRAYLGRVQRHYWSEGWPPPVDVILRDIGGWLDEGNDPGTLSPILTAGLSQKARELIVVSSDDVTGDGQADVLVKIRLDDIPLLVFVRGADGHYVGYPLPSSMPQDVDSRPITEYSTGNAGVQPALQVTDLTGDGLPEIILVNMFIGGDGIDWQPMVFQWRQTEFRTVFQARLDNRHTESSFVLEPAPGVGKLIHVSRLSWLSPHKEEYWQWDEQAGKYQAKWQVIQPGANGPTELRLAEQAFQVGDYQAAAQRFAAFLSDLGWQERYENRGQVTPKEITSWIQLAKVRRGVSLAMLNRPAQALEALSSVGLEGLAGRAAASFIEGYTAKGDLLGGLLASEHLLATERDRAANAQPRSYDAFDELMIPQPTLMLAILNQSGSRGLATALASFSIPITQTQVVDLNNDGSAEVVWVAHPGLQLDPWIFKPSPWQQAWVAWRDGANWRATGIAAAERVELLAETQPDARGERAIQLRETDFLGTKTTKLSWDGQSKWLRSPSPTATIAE